MVAAVAMRFEEVFAQLEAWGSEGYRKVYARHGAGDNQFGVGLGNLRALAKKLKTNHELARQLWETGNADAMILSTMLMDAGQLSAQELDGMVRSLTYFKVVDELVDNVVVKSSHADDLRARWRDSPEELVGRAGWYLLIEKIMSGDAVGTGERGETDALDLDGVLEKIEAGILAAPKRKQEAMNRCLVEIGIYRPEYRRKCLALGERLGRFDTTPVPKGCTSSYAPEWTAAVLKRKKNGSEPVTQ